MGEFLKFVRAQFDIVIIDSAPTLAVTDGILIGAQSDGVVLCLRAGYVQKRDAKSCRDRLLQAEVKLLGVVLNRHQGVEGRYRSGYSSSYGGAYGADGKGEAYGAAGQAELDPSASPSPAETTGSAGSRAAKKRGVAAV